MQQIDFKHIAEQLAITGYKALPTPPSIAIPNARQVLYQALQYLLGGKAKWLAEYEEIAAWLTDNHNKGLLLMGNCGTGKTLICQHALPLLLHHYHNLILSTRTAQELNAQPDDIIKLPIVYIDDIGTEDIANHYGNRRIPFAELVDEAEREGKLLIVTTNLNSDSLTQKYGERVIDRLRAITHKVIFTEKSMRK